MKRMAFGIALVFSFSSFASAQQPALSAPGDVDAAGHKRIMIIDPGPLETITFNDGTQRIVETEVRWRPFCGSDLSQLNQEQFAEIVNISRAASAAITAQVEANGLPAAPRGVGLDVVFNVDGSVPGAAVTALALVEAYIEGTWTDNATITINLDYANLGGGVLGATGSNYVSNESYSTTRTNLIANMDADDTIQSFLPTPTLPIRYDASSATVTAENLVDITRGNYNAIYNLTTGTAASMTLNSTFSWDYDPSNGNSSNSFVDVMIHEVGHAMGFTSAADGGATDPELIDLYRFQRSDGASDYNPDDTAEFTTTPRLIDFNNPTNDDVNSDIISAEYRMSDGNPWQASHFFENSPSSQIMDPCVCSGGETFYPNYYQAGDMAMFDAIGWDFSLEAGTTTLPFSDAFPSTTIDSAKWTGIQGVTSGTGASNEPSSPNSINIPSTPSTGTQIRSATIDMTSFPNATVSYKHSLRGGAGNDSPETGDDLIVEYRNNAGSWIELNRHLGSGSDTTTFTSVGPLDLPADAAHSSFRLRFRNPSTEAAGADDWWVDDVAIDTGDVTGPTPNPLTWSSQPAAISTSSVSMTATTASDPNGPVEYNFEFLAPGNGGTTSGWSASNTYTDTGLDANTSYSYRAQARDGVVPPNTGGFTPVIAAITPIETPTTPTFGTVTTTSIIVNAGGTFTNLTLLSSGLFFDSTTTGGDTGLNDWIQTTSDTATGLTPSTNYTFQVKARNQSLTETSFSSTAAKATLANIPAAMTTSNLLTYTITLDVNANGNGPAAEYAIQCNFTPHATWSGKWVDASGNPAAAEVWQTEAAWGAIAVQSLRPSTTYSFRTKARNPEGVQTTNSAASIFSTPANTAPAAPTFGTPTTTTLPITNIDPNGNTSVTEFAVQCTAANPADATWLSMYVNASGNPQAAETWSSEAAWESRTIQGLDPNLTYTFAVKARDPALNETVLGTGTNATTLAVTPSAPVLANPTTTTLDLTDIIAAGNPSDTEYAVQCVSTNPADATWNAMYVNATGNPSASAVWRTETTWQPTTIQSLDPNGDYAFAVKARNRVGVETAFGPSASQTKLANVPGAPGLGNATVNSIDLLTINTNGNNSQTQYAVRVTATSPNDAVWNNMYVSAAGNPSVTAVWQDQPGWEPTTLLALQSSTQYTLAVKARNQQNVETVFGSTASLSTTTTVDPTPPAAPGLGSPTTSTIPITNIDNNGNLTLTTYAVRCTASNPNDAGWTNMYVDASGNPQAAETWSSEAAWEARTIQGLDPNATYTFAVKGRDAALNQTAFGAGASQTTLAITPIAPVLANPTTTTLDLTDIIANGNPSDTEYAVRCMSTNPGDPTWTGQYVDAAGNPAASEVWRTESAWQPTTIQSLDPNGDYAFAVKARNRVNVETAFGPSASQTKLANIPGAPGLGNATTSSIELLDINPNGNNNQTQYAVRVLSTSPTDPTWDGKSVDAAGNPSGSAVWQLEADWETTVLLGLQPTTQYTLAVKARNQQNVETIFGSSASLTTLTPADVTPPSPDPMSFASAPAPISPFEINMTATTASDPAGVEYFFNAVSGPGADDSGFQASASYADTGLTPNTAYSYRVKARDLAPALNETAYSAASNTATFIQTPTTVSFGTITTDSIQVSADGVFTNLTTGTSGLFFEMTPAAGSGANIWVQTTSITVTGLTPDTEYTFRVKARNQNSIETAFGSTDAASTAPEPQCDLLGDIDQDGFVTGADIAGYVRAKLGQAPEAGEDQTCADFGTGTIPGDNALFVTALLN